MSYKDFAEDFRSGRTGSVFFFYGRENLLIRWAINAVIKKYVTPEYRDLNVLQLDESADMEKVVSSAMTYSMFPGKRVILVRNLPVLHRKGKEKSAEDDAARKQMERLAGEQPDSSIIIFYLDSMYSGSGKLNAAGKALAKKCSAYEMGAISPAELKQFISKRLRAADKLITAKDMDYLVSVTGYFNKESTVTLDEIEKNLEKLTGAEDGQRISRELIDEMMIGDEERFVFSMIDALGRKDKRTAFQLILNNLEKAESKSDENKIAISLTGLLTSQLEMMYDSLELSERGMTPKEMAKELGANEYRLSKAYQAARGYGRKRIKNLLIQVYDIDQQFKTGRMESSLALELFAASI